MTRDEKWMLFCLAGAEIFSTCAKRQYFSVVISPHGRCVGMGYNGAPPGVPHCVDGFCPRLHQGSVPGSSYDNCISVHAEENALLFSNFDDRVGSTLVVSGTPCFGCAKKIAGSGVTRLVYIVDEYEGWPHAEEILRLAHVETTGLRTEDLRGHH